MEADLRRLASALSLSADITDEALHILAEVGSKAHGKGQLCCVACIYVAVTKSRFQETEDDSSPDSVNVFAPCVTLQDILTKANANIVMLFHAMKTSHCMEDASSHVREAYSQLQRKYCIVAALHLKFEKLFAAIFQENPSPFSSSTTTTVTPRMKQSWLIFLLAKGKVLQGNPELVLNFHLLLCCLAHIIRWTPSFLLRPPYADVILEHLEDGLPDKEDSGTVPVLVGSILKVLCTEMGCGYDDVESVYHSCWIRYTQTLPVKEGLPELSWLETEYRSLYLLEGDIDETTFLHHDRHLISPSSDSDEASGIPHTSQTDPLCTPVRTAMTTVQQLKNILNSAQDEPSSTLKTYFNNCSTDPTEGILQRVSALKTAFVSRFLQATGDNYRDIAEQRCHLAIRMYYRVMEAMLKMEEQRLNTSDFSNLLNKDTFHRSLLACSVEVIMTTYGVCWTPMLYTMATTDTNTSFPWILDVFELKAYDFFKVLETFILAEPKLTKEVIKHLQHIENKILERVAWREGSPLYEAILTSEMPRPSFQTSPGSRVTNGSIPHSSTASEMYLSPTRFSAAQQSPYRSPGSASSRLHCRSPGPHRRKSQSLQLFYNKVCKLAYMRLQSLCKLLCVSAEMEHRIWTALEFCLLHRPELLKNRHLDQIVMCSVYAICKVSGCDTKFKSIVAAYKNLPTASQTVYKEAWISGEEYDSIIGFYNRVYMQTLKNYILRFTSPDVMPQLSPLPCKSPSRFSQSPVITVPGRSNFYISPLREPPFSSPVRRELLSPGQMTPRTRALYSFGEGLGSSEKLRAINESMRAAAAGKRTSPGQPRSQKRLKFDADTTDTNGTTTKSSTTNGHGVSNGNSSEHGNGTTADLTSVTRSAWSLSTAKSPIKITRQSPKK
ncbi:retinoblastoma-associated protein-like [Branchiostoma floridae x Branchiostoma belcheri]